MDFRISLTGRGKKNSKDFRIGIFEILWVTAICMFLTGYLIPIGVLLIIVATMIRYRYYRRGY